MVRKIKIRVKADNVNISLPSIPISFFKFAIKMSMRFMKTTRFDDEEVDEKLVGIENKLSNYDFSKNEEAFEISTSDGFQVFDELGNVIEDKTTKIETEADFKEMINAIDQFLKLAKPILDELDPFTLVEVNSADAYVLIEMR